MDFSLSKTERSYRFFAKAIVVVALLAALFNAVAGLLYTMTFYVETASFNAQGIIHRDNIAANLLFVLAGVVLLALLAGVRPSKAAAKWFCAAVLAGTAAWGIAWILRVRSLPYADGHDIMLTLQDVIAGAKPVGNSLYFQKFPYQSGYALYEEALLRLFGAESLFIIPVINVLATVLAEAAVLCVAGTLWNDTRVTFLTALLLLLCTQPILFCAHFYGNMPGLFLAAWGCYGVIRYFSTGRIPWLVLAVALIPWAILLKNNYYICLIACGILLLLFALRKKAWVPVAGAAVMVCLAVLLPKAAWRQFAGRIGVEPGAGTPLTAYLVMGGQETRGANPGWYNMYSYYIYEDNDGDPERMRAQIRRDLSSQLDQWKRDPVERVSFYVRKAVTQWNEPTFQSVWINQVSYRDVELNAFENSLLFGRGRTLYEGYCNRYVQVLYTLYAAGLLLTLLRRALAPERLLLPLWVFGAFLYHFFFEAQSQYAVMYLPMLLPYAAYAAVFLRDGLRGKKPGPTEK